ncbi:unnamed protein product, partial [Callosobruchus maculatus]
MMLSSQTVRRGFSAQHSCGRHRQPVQTIQSPRCNSVTHPSASRAQGCCCPTIKGRRCSLRSHVGPLRMALHLSVITEMARQS